MDNERHALDERTGVGETQKDKLLSAIPTNWLDPLLTGPDKVLPSGCSFTCIDIENLLRAIRDRVKKIIEEGA